MAEKTNQQGDGKSPEEEEFVLVEVGDDGQRVNKIADSGDQDDSDLEDEDELPDDSDDEGEERVGHTDDSVAAAAQQQGQTAEQKRERRKREKHARRVRQQTLNEVKDRLIADQAQRLHNLNTRMAAIEGRTITHDVNLLGGQVQSIERDLETAKSTLAKLLKAGDGEGAAEITEIQITLREQLREAQLNLQQAKKQRPTADGQGARGEPAVREQPVVMPEVRVRADAWVAANKWYNPRSVTEDTDVVRAIDKALTREGMNPATDAYWAELTKRVSKRLPEHFPQRRANGKGNGQENGKAAGGPSRPQSASVSGQGHRPLGKNEVYITPARRQAMEAAGAWDDLEKRKRYLASYAKYDKEHGAPAQH